MKLLSKSVNPVRKFKLKSYSILSNGVNNTLNIGRIIAKNLQKGDIICLFGELGAGKTVLTKGIALRLGIKRNAIVSPSFVLIRQYTGNKFNFYHFDLYRLKRPRDIIALGYEEFLYDEAITVIEWADRLEYLMPEEYLKVELFIRTNSQRLIRFKAFGRRYKELLNKINKDIKN